MPQLPFLAKRADTKQTFDLTLAKTHVLGLSCSSHPISFRERHVPSHMRSDSLSMSCLAPTTVHSCASLVFT